MYIPKTQPYEHQNRARRAAMLNTTAFKPAFAWFLEMGLGKTKVDIDESCEMFELGLIDVWIIVAPKGVFRNWDTRELPTHVPDRIWSAARVLHWLPGGGGKAHQQALNALLVPGPGLRILVINIEAFSTGKIAREYVARLLASKTKGAKGTIDESTTIKNPGARRTDAIADLRDLLDYRRILTGSPVTRSPLDLYGQFMFLQGKPLGFSSFYSFRARYAIMKKMDFGGRKVQIVVGYREIDDLNKRIAPLSYRIRKDECLDLPPKIYQQRDVELTDEQRRLYSEIKENATAMLDDMSSHVTATAVITQILRLHQIACGFVTDEMGVLHDVSSNRISELMDVLEETDGKVIIWSRYRRNVDQIVAAISKVYGSESIVQFHGGVDGKDRETAVMRFQGDPARGVASDPACRFMISNPQTGGYGNTWTVARTTIYYSNSFDLQERLQSEDRNHRVGQTGSVNYVDLVCPGTVDEKILKALRNKINISSTVLGDGYREWLI
jgi:SNF2 family DNA or RNA helicase